MKTHLRIRLLTAPALLFLTSCVTTTPVAHADTPTFSWPTPTKTVTLSKTIVVPANTTFDGKLAAYKGASNMGDGGQGEGQKPLFLLEPGATLINTILVFPACDGVHMRCAALRTTKVKNLFVKDCGEDAITVSGHGNALIESSQFQFATDKVIQDNSAAKLTIRKCKFRKFERAIRMCGTCPSNTAYDVTAVDCTAYDGNTFMKASTPKARGEIRGLKASKVKKIADATGGAKISIR